MDHAGTQPYICMDDVICLHRMIVAKPGCERTHRSVNQRREESFYSLYKRGKGPDPWSGVGPKGDGLSLLLSSNRPGKSHGWKSLVGCSPWGHQESDMTERLNNNCIPSGFCLLRDSVAAFSSFFLFYSSVSLLSEALWSQRPF